ncbi:DUF473 family protein [Thermococcus aggregans]|uniref:DUF473 family protein n=1 Tax=Thermococcus aggregans TaxID=110163 RepID=A0A9E7MY80_THEAG|nr:DUF473 family protein [Thermococcus aggregans]USS41114.1 DUF473 family protein [Thermococcus aggregans]
MELPVLGGIARRALDQLLKNPYRTIEVRSARNVIVARRLKAREKLFLTYETPQDITRGTEGIIAEVMKIEEMEQRIPWEESDEREITVCRIQLRLVGLGKVIEVSSEGDVMKVKVREMLPHEMAMS